MPTDSRQRFPRRRVRQVERLGVQHSEVDVPDTQLDRATLCDGDHAGHEVARYETPCRPDAFCREEPGVARSRGELQQILTRLGIDEIDQSLGDLARVLPEKGAPPLPTRCGRLPALDALVRGGGGPADLRVRLRHR